MPTAAVSSRLGFTGGSRAAPGRASAALDDYEPDNSSPFVPMPKTITGSFPPCRE